MIPHRALGGESQTSVTHDSYGVRMEPTAPAKDTDDRRARYRVLARLGAAERRIDRVEKEWAEFRRFPTPGRLTSLRRSVTAADRALERLANSLDRAESGTAPNDRASVSVPTPRDLVAAGRDLDRLIHDAVQTWLGSRSELDAAALDRISGMLDRADRAATTLLEALRALEEAPRASTESRPPDESLPAEATLQELLDHVSSAWAILGRNPSVDGTRHLQAILRRARQQSEALSALARTASPLSTPESLRYLGGGAESVGFTPYRDRRTGAYNGRGFEVSAAAELSRCARYGRSFGLILMGLEVDDRGAARSVIGAIRGLLRSTDLIGHAARDRLVLALPGSDGRATRRIAARILRALDSAEHSASVRRLTYAVAPEDGRSLAALLDHARERLAEPDRPGADRSG